jgi:hypothetical protein
MEDELTEMARPLRQIRGDWVSGIVPQEEFVKVETQFMDKLSEQRKHAPIAAQCCREEAATVMGCLNFLSA